MTIQIIKNFISEEEAYPISYFIEHNLGRFALNLERKRWMIRFGYDEELPEQAVYGMDSVEEIKDMLLEIFDKTAKVIGEEVYLTSWFLSKQFSGGQLNPHTDGVPGGPNNQLEYTAMLYLNTLDNNGTIYFPDAGFGITPEIGDLIIFKSKEDRHQVSEITQDRYSLPMWFTKDKKFEFVA
jgi:hypothetical protein